MILAFLLWTAILALYLATFVFALHQWRLPFRFRTWQWAWGCKTLAIAFLIARRLYILSQWESRLAQIDLLEMLFTLPFAVCFFVANWCHAQMYRTPFVLQEMPPACITINAVSCILQWNAAAEMLFGYAAGEALGQDLATLIVPARSQAAHRAGIQRWLTAPPLAQQLPARLPVTARHKNGSEFPVEVLVTAVVTRTGVELRSEIRQLIRL